MHPPLTSENACSGNCSGCGVGEGPAPESELRGARLVGWASGVFLLPPVAAFAGAFWAGPTPAAQALGGVAGFLLGALAARGLYRWRTPFTRG